MTILKQAAFSKIPFIYIQGNSWYPKLFPPTHVWETHKALNSCYPKLFPSTHVSETHKALVLHGQQTSITHQVTAQYFAESTEEQSLKACVCTLHHYHKFYIWNITFFLSFILYIYFFYIFFSFFLAIEDCYNTYTTNDKIWKHTNKPNAIYIDNYTIWCNPVVMAN